MSFIYSITLANGSVVTENSKRDFSHAVIAQYPEGTEGDDFLVSLNGTEALALKSANTWRNRGFRCQVVPATRTEV